MRSALGEAMTAVFEREGVLARMALTLQRARDGQGGSLFIIGEAGLGKTTLLERAQAMADGFEVGYGRGQAIESGLPFGLVSEALGRLGGPNPLEAFADGQVAGIDARATYFYGTLERFESRRDRRYLLLLDDLHWADADSLALLSFLCRRISELPIAIIATARPWPETAVDLARNLARQEYDVGVEQLFALSEHSATALLSERVGEPLSEEKQRQAWETCGGNPLLLVQVARAIKEGRAIPQPTGGDDDPGALLVQLLPGMDLRYGHAASVFGNRFRPALAAEVAGIGERPAAEALEALVKAGLVRSASGGRAQFAHPLFRQVLYDDVPAAVRERLHATAFRALVAHGVDDAEASEQASLGHLVGDQQAITVLQRAARTAMKAGALATARKRMQEAVRLAGENAPATLLLGLAEALLSNGEPRAAVEAYRRVLAGDELAQGTRARTHRLLGRALFVTGELEGAESEFEAAVTSAGDELDEAVEALTDHATALWISGGPRRAVQYALQARELAGAAALDVRLRAETTWALAAFLGGDPEGIDAAKDAARQAGANPELERFDPTWGWGSLGTFMFIAKYAELYDQMDSAFRLAYAGAERLGAPLALGMLSTLEADNLARRGRLEDALASAARATAMVEVVPWLATFAWIAQAGVLELMGRHEECEMWCDRIATVPQSFIGRLWLLRTRALILVRKGENEKASDLFRELQQVADESGLLEPCVVPWSRDAIRTHLAAGRVELAQAVMDWLERASARLPCRWPKFILVGARAALAEREDRFEEADRLHREALAMVGTLDQPLSMARAQIDYGSFLRRRGSSAEARAHLSGAARTALESHAGWLAEQAKEELNLAGGRLRTRHRALDELTPQEQRVGSLAARGLSYAVISNALNVDKRTVETHLQHIYQKFGIHSQRELMKAWDSQKFSSSADDGAAVRA